MRVLDPACGSGNFLYVSLKQLLDLEKEVIAFAREVGLPGVLPEGGAGAGARHRAQRVRPRTGHGDGVDRLHPVAEGQRLRPARRADPQAPGDGHADGRDPGVRRATATQ